MQLQSLLLAEASVQRNPENMKERCEELRKELLQWHQSWKTNFITGELHDWGGAVQCLETWGSLQYYATILLIFRFSLERAEEAFDAVREVVSCTSIIVRQHQKLFCATYDDEMRHQVPVFPTDWTLSHLLFATALHLLPSMKIDAADYNSWERTVRSCLTTMALMEADPANLSIGFSKILEELLQ